MARDDPNSQPSKRSSPESSATGQRDAPAQQGCVLVGIGASAGALDAFKRLLRTLPSDPGMAFVLVQHLDPSHDSLMAELLTKHTPLPVVQVHETTVIEPDTVYMIPPNKFIKVHRQTLVLDEPIRRRGLRLPIDYFFGSLAEARGERAIAVVLSGTGSDGAEGLREVKGAGGMTIAQLPEEAEFGGMPGAAVGTGAVDRVLPIDAMAEAILAFGRHSYTRPADEEQLLAAAAPDHYRAILSLVKSHTGHDFSRYKTGTLSRRIERRMGVRHVLGAEDYLSLLRSEPNEAQALFRDMLIGVTRFFRDPVAWDALEEALEQNLRGHRDDEPVRVWVPGCASGEEAYSLAILLFELQQRHKKRWDIQIFATDIDRDAVDVARIGRYPESIAADLSPERLEGFFQHDGGRVRVKKRLRETCIFAVQGLLSDPPFSNLDLISCRNLLIYLDSEVQQRLVDVFHFGLSPGGLLFLGNSEAPKQSTKRFESVSLPHRIYRRVEGGRAAQGGFPVMGRLGNPLERTAGNDEERPSGPSLGTVERSKKALLEEFAPASVVVNHRGLIQYIHGPVRRYLDFPSGEPDLELTALTLEGLRAKTRTALNQARTNKDTVSLVAQRVRRDNELLAVRVRVQPLPAGQGGEPLFLVSFVDEPRQAAFARDDAPPPPEASEPEAAALNRQLALELEATREDLQSTIEELESSNEELKASNEEVMSMNEELQSTNEELETSREELQSLNEELSTVNAQLHEKVRELETTSNDLANLLASTDVATLFLDSSLRIRRYTPATKRLMRLRDGDIGRPLSDLSSEVDDPELKTDVETVLDSLAPIQKEVFRPPNSWFMRRVTPFRTGDDRIQGVVVTYSEISEVKQTVRRLEQRERQQAAIAKLGRSALATGDLQDLLERASALVAETLEVDLVKVLRLEPDRQSLRLVAGVGWEPEIIGEALVPGGPDSQAGYTLKTAEPVISPDLRREKRFSGPALLTDHAVISGISVLIGPESTPWGVLGAHARHEVAFTDDDANFVQAIANLLWEAARRHRVEEELSTARERMAAFLNSTAVVSWMKDAGDGRYMYLSSSYERAFGIRAADWLGRTDADIWPPKTAAELAANDRRVLQSGEPLETVEEIELPDGRRLSYLVSKFPFIESDGRHCIGGLGVDISARVRAEQALAQSEKRMREAARVAGFGTYYGNLDEGTISWSPEFKALVGLPPDAPDLPIGKVPDFVHPDDRERVQAEVHRSLDPAGDGFFRDEHRILRPDGSERWVLMQGGTEFAGEGAQRRARTIAGTLLDITERHAFEEAIQQARARADAANVAKSQFLANMSHEIRTPLTAILGFTEVLAARLEAEDDQACLRTIKQNGTHLRQILDDFLDLAKVEAGKLSVQPVPCEVAGVIAETRSLFTARAEQKGLALIAEARGPIPRVIETDPKCLRQILLNLVGNAIKFTDQGSVRILVDCLPEAERLRIEVVDTGIGIDHESLEAVFEAFRQVDGSTTRSAGGTGLGLSITKRLVAALGGEIKVTSEPGRGSSFQVELPIDGLDGDWLEPDDDLFGEHDEGVAAEPVPSLDGARVLVVDDNRDLRLLLHELIEQAGGEPLDAADGDQCLTKWAREREQSRPIDAILMDMQMPVMDGLEATRRLRAGACGTPIIALTASAMQKDRDDAVAAGCNDFISKPVERIELLQTVARWIGRAATEPAPDAEPESMPGPETEPRPATEPDAESHAAMRSGGLSILCVDDHLDTRTIQKTLLEMLGHRVTIAAGGTEALQAVEQMRPDAALIDIGLEDMSGLELVAQLRERPALAGCLFVCISGQEEDETRWKDAGFDLFLQKPVAAQRLREVLAGCKPGTTDQRSS